jgi:hypothetical protein
MPRGISRQTSYSGATVDNLSAQLGYMLMPHMVWTNANQQNAFNRAMQLYHHRNVNLEQRRTARRALHKLVHNHNRTWTLTPPAARFRNTGYISELNSIFNSNRNNNSNNVSSAPVAWNTTAYLAGLNPQPAVAAAPNYSKASNAVKKWLSTRPHTVHQNVVHIKLPANAKDPVNLYNFKPGNEAVMVIKKRLQRNGAMRSTRTFYKKNTIGSMAAVHRRIARPHSNPVPWRTILGMKGSDVVFKDPLNRRSVYRRDIMNVKFATPRS